MTLDAPELEKMKELIVNGRIDRYVPTLQYVLLAIDYTLKPELRYGISVAFVNRQWHEALSGIVDLSLSPMRSICPISCKMKML